MTHYQDGLLASPSDHVYSSLNRKTKNIENNQEGRDDTENQKVKETEMIDKVGKEGEENVKDDQGVRLLTTQRKDWSFTIHLDSDYA